MSGSETGVMTSREPFNVGALQQQQQQHQQQQQSSSPPPAQPLVQNMRLGFSSDGNAVYKPISAATNATAATTTATAAVATSPTYQLDGGSGGGAVNVNVNMGSMSGGEQAKRKRGRPRKYGPDGSMALGLTPTAQPVPVAQTQSSGGGGFSSPHPAPTPPPSAPTSLPSGGSAPPTSFKKARGRPPGSSSKKHQLEALGSAGVGFTPHVITVKAGEDVSSKIMAFSQNGPRAVCIMSANGAISNVTLRQPATSGGTVTYEGRFEILSLSGSFLLTENGGQRSRTGGLSVSLSGPDGRVLGGGVAGLLTAATPIQVVVGSFITDGRKESKSANHMEPLNAPSKLGPGGGHTGASSPPSRGTLSESSGGPGSPLNHSTGACNNSNPQGMSSMAWK
ncbi:AT-hook motif nuclear-localized protein 10 [Quercus robur]|uniref:AT-hook motif nuclear-localized protein 10 n=1 Tax=Quercus robur TaxID=38942 RepID=UPI0021625DA0|nr:AT-hook motif nuclear-localized protein 10 [Quercus robur]XP_050267994.1 AT-hook motif nuclear-localized protein 10 [Quercus robur]